MEEDLSLGEIAQQLAGLAAVLRELAEKPIFEMADVANDDDEDPITEP